MILVKQLDPKGCGIACAAMLAGVSYEQAKEKLQREMGWHRDAGTSYGLLPTEVNRLAQELGAIVSPYIAPCIIQVRRGGMGHYVVVTAEGNILDPAA